jgi:hypothetical protein
VERVMNGLFILKIFAKENRFIFKDLLLGKLFIPKTNDKFDEFSDIGKKMVRTIKLNEIA